MLSQPSDHDAVGQPASARLDSWKEIAAYLKREIRTVRRWEKGEGLPVHRHLHSKRGTVYAFKPELDAWWSARQSRVDKPGQQTMGGEKRRLLGLMTASLAVVILGGGTYFAGRHSTSQTRAAKGRIMLAVLPFENLSGDPQQDYFSDGLTEEMISQLGHLQPQRLGVIARTSTMQFKGSKKDIHEIGRELGVDYVLEGSVRRVGQRVRISAQLIQVSDQTHLLSETYDRDLRDVLALQSAVAGAIASEIQVTPQRRLRLVSQSLNADAYELYLRARFHWNRRSQEDLITAASYLQKATELDPKFALAYAGLADTYVILGEGDFIPATEAFPRAKAAALRALEIDANLAQAYSSLAHLEFLSDWNFKGAEEEFKRAIELNPSYATAHHWYGMLLSALGRHEEAIYEMKQARRLDPLSPVINVNAAWVQYRARRYDSALQELQKASDIDPNYIRLHYLRACIYVQKGMLAEATAEFHAFDGQALSGVRSPLRLAGLAYEDAVLGHNTEAAKIVDEMERQNVLPYDIAYIFAALGERDVAFQWLYKAYDGHSARLVENLKVDPALDPLRSDSRFTELLHRTGLQP